MLAIASNVNEKFSYVFFLYIEKKLEKVKMMMFT